MKDNKCSANKTWEILGRHLAYNTSSKRCSLCFDEKLKIVLRRNSMLNRQTVTLNKCRHKNKYALILYDIKSWAEFPFKVSMKCFTQNYRFQISASFFSPGSSPDYWTHVFPGEAFCENFNVKLYCAGDTMV